MNAPCDATFSFQARNLMRTCISKHNDNSYISSMVSTALSAICSEMNRVYPELEQMRPEENDGEACTGVQSVLSESNPNLIMFIICFKNFSILKRKLAQLTQCSSAIFNGSRVYSLFMYKKIRHFLLFSDIQKYVL